MQPPRSSAIGAAIGYAIGAAVARSSGASMTSGPFPEAVFDVLEFINSRANGGFYLATATQSAPVWDAATKQADVTLSNGNLTASTTQYANYANAKTLISHSTGKWVARFPCVYPSVTGLDAELNIGLVPPAWNPSTDLSPGVAPDSWGFNTDGYSNGGGFYTDISKPVPSGQAEFIFVDFDAGKIWFGNEAGPAGNPEAGTGAIFTFTPNTELTLACSMYSATPPGLVSTTLDPTYSSGTFAAWEDTELNTPIATWVDQSAHASSPVWDAAAKAASVTLTGGNLTAETNSPSNNDGVRSTTSHSSGKHSMKFVYNYSSLASDEEIGAGPTTGAWDYTAANTTFAGLWAYFAEGSLLNENVFVYNPATLPTCANGGYVKFLIDFDTGKVWIKTAAGVTGDPEAGTGAAFTFTPNTPLYAAFTGYKQGATNPSATFDPSDVDGTFQAWNAVVNNVTQPDASKRAIRSTRVGNVMAQYDLVDDVYPTPAAAVGQECTYFFVSMHGTQCFTWDGTPNFPVTQASQWGWVLGTVTSQERADIIAALDATWINDHHDLEVIDTTHLNPHAYYNQGQFTVNTDPAVCGAIVTFDFETSATSANQPPWTYDSPGTNFMSYITGLTSREYADIVVSVDADLANFGVGLYASADFGQVFDLTRWPAMEVFHQWSYGLEGTIPDPATWPANLAVLNLWATPYLSGNNARLAGRWPSFVGASCAASLKLLKITNADLTGELDISPFAAVVDTNFGDLPRTTKISARNLAISSGVISGGSIPLCRDLDFNGTTLNQTYVDGWLSVINSNGLSNGTIDLRVAAGVTPSAAGLVTKGLLEGRGYTVLVNP